MASGATVDSHLIQAGIRGCGEARGSPLRGSGGVTLDFNGADVLSMTGSRLSTMAPWVHSCAQAAQSMA